MPVDETQKTQLVTNVTNIVRHSHVKVDAQRFGMAFRATLEDLEPGQAIELDPIFHYFQQEMGVGEKEALELCILVAAKKDKLGFAINLPEKAQSLTTDALETIVGQVRAKSPSTGSWDVRNKEPEKPLPGKKVDSGTPWAPDKKKKKKGVPVNRQKRLLMTFGAMVFAAVGFHSWLAGTRADPIVEIEAPPGGLNCTKIITNGAVALCDIKTAEFEALAPETLNAKGIVTKNALKSRGVTDLWVRLEEKSKIKAVF